MVGYYCQFRASGCNCFDRRETLRENPLKIQLSSRVLSFEISAAHFKTWKHRLNVKPNEPQEIRDIRLQPADGKPTVNTKPDGANIIVDGTFVGQTPLTLDLSPDKRHAVQISKAGYEKTNRNVQVVSAESKQLNVNLKPRQGIVHLSVKPPDTELDNRRQIMGNCSESIESDRRGTQTSIQ